MRGVRSVVSKLRLVPLVALLSIGGCAAASEQEAYYDLQGLMGWNPEMQQELAEQAEAMGIVPPGQGLIDPRTGRNPNDSHQLGFHHFF